MIITSSGDEKAELSQKILDVLYATEVLIVTMYTVYCILYSIHPLLSLSNHSTMEHDIYLKKDKNDSYPHKTLQITSFSFLRWTESLIFQDGFAIPDESEIPEEF